MLKRFKIIIKSLLRKKDLERISLVNYEGFRFSISKYFYTVKKPIRVTEIRYIINDIFSKPEYSNLGYEVSNCIKYNTYDLSEFLNYLDRTLRDLDIVLQKDCDIHHDEIIIKLNNHNVEILISAYHSICLFIENFYKFSVISRETPQMMCTLEGSGLFQHLKDILEEFLITIPNLNIERINAYTNPELFTK